MGAGIGRFLRKDSSKMVLELNPDHPFLDLIPQSLVLWGFIWLVLLFLHDPHLNPVKAGAAGMPP